MHIDTRRWWKAFLEQRQHLSRRSDARRAWNAFPDDLRFLRSVLQASGPRTTTAATEHAPSPSPGLSHPWIRISCCSAAANYCFAEVGRGNSQRGPGPWPFAAQLFIEWCLCSGSHCMRMMSSSMTSMYWRKKFVAKEVKQIEKDCSFLTLSVCTTRSHRFLVGLLR